MNDLAAIKVIKLEPGERTDHSVFGVAYGCVAFRCDWELSRIEDTCQFLACCGVCPYCGVVIFMQSAQSDVEV